MPAAPATPSVSEVAFGSFLAYSPHGKSEVSQRSRRICHSIKQDRPSHDPTLRMIEFAVKRLAQENPLELGAFLWHDATLVPVPRSAPFPPGATNALWVPARICRAMVASGYGAAVQPLLERFNAVPKSAYAAPGSRPGVAEHLASMRVRASLVPLERVILVDDVLTRGATLIAAAHLIRTIYPRADVRAFALFRARGFVADIAQIVDPAIGRISLAADGTLTREP